MGAIFKIWDDYISPASNALLDLGSSSLEWKDLYIDGVANIDSLIADTADINGGTLDGVAIAADCTQAEWDAAYTHISESGASHTYIDQSVISGSTPTFGGANITGVASIVIADESADTTCFPLFVTAATGTLSGKTGTNITFNSNTGLLTATTLAGANTNWDAAYAHVSNDGSDHSFIDQDVTITGTPTFGVTTLGDSSQLASSAAPTADADIANKKYVDDNSGGAPEGTAVLSTGEGGGTKYLREDGDDTCSWQTPAGSGDLLADGTVPLTANWDVGAFTITGLTFVSDQATGTAPFTVASTTEVTNLKSATATLAATTTALATARNIGGVSFDGTAAIVPTTIVVADTTDTTCYVGLWESATGDLLPKSDAGITYNAGTGMLTATGFTGPLTGEAATVATITGLAPDTATTQATQASITTCVNLVSVGALDSGSITSGFTSIDVGAGAIDGGVITADTNFAGDLTGDVTGNASGSSGSCTGNAATATALATARNIGGVAFDGSAAIVPTTIVVADESADTTCFVGFFTAATGDLLPKTGTNLIFNSSTGLLTATGFAGDLTGDVTGNVSGSSGSCTGEAATVATITGLAPDTATTQAAQPNITALGTITSLIATTADINGGTLDGVAIAADCTQTEWDAAYTHSVDNTQAHTDYLLNSGNDTTSGTITSTGFIVADGQTVGATTAKWTFDDSNDDISTTSDVGIGTAIPTQQLELTACMELADTTSSSLGVIYKNGQRFIHNYQDLVGGGAVPAGRNLFFGQLAGNFTMGSTATQTYHSSANTGIGYETLLQVTTGFANSAFGQGSLRGCTSGYRNTGFGQNTLYSLNTNNSNVAVGYFAGRWVRGNYNMLLGVESGEGVQNQSTPDRMIAIGHKAGTNVTTGDDNILFGYQTGDLLTTGSDNIIIGNDIDPPANNTDNYLNIGNLLYGDMGNAHGGVNTATPGYTWDINGELGLFEKGADPTEPAEGHAVIWMSDGTGKGDDGDVLIASKAGGTTNYSIVFDHSAGTGW